MGRFCYHGCFLEEYAIYRSLHGIVVALIPLYVQWLKYRVLKTEFISL